MIARRRVLLVGAAAVVLAAVALITFLLTRHETSGNASPAAPSSSSAPSHPIAPRLDATRARTLSSALTSGDETAIKSVFDMSSSQPLDPAAIAGLHALGRVDFDLSSFHDDGDGTATVDATTPATATTPAQPWHVLLVASPQHQWLISQTDAE